MKKVALKTIVVVTIMCACLTSCTPVEYDNETQTQSTTIDDGEITDDDI